MRVNPRPMLLALAWAVLACEAPKKAEPKPVPAPPAETQKQGAPVTPPDPVATPAAREAITVALDGKRPLEERRAAVAKLAQLKEPAAVMPLLALLDGNEGTAGVEAETRAALTMIDAVGFLQRRLQSGTVEERRMVPDLLAKLHDPGAAEVLLAHQDDADDKIREHTAAGLGQIRERRALPGMVKHLADPVADVRSACAQALGMIGGAEALSALEAAQKSEKDEFVRIFLEKGIAQAKAGK